MKVLVLLLLLLVAACPTLGLSLPSPHVVHQPRTELPGPSDPDAAADITLITDFFTRSIARVGVPGMQFAAYRGNHTLDEVQYSTDLQEGAYLIVVKGPGGKAPR